MSILFWLICPRRQSRGLKMCKLMKVVSQCLRLSHFRGICWRKIHRATAYFTPQSIAILTDLFEHICFCIQHVFAFCTKTHLNPSRWSFISTCPELTFNSTKNVCLTSSLWGHREQLLTHLPIPNYPSSIISDSRAATLRGGKSPQLFYDRPLSFTTEDHQTLFNGPDVSEPLASGSDKKQRGLDYMTREDNWDDFF